MSKYFPPFLRLSWNLGAAGQYLPAYKSGRLAPIDSGCSFCILAHIFRAGSIKTNPATSAG
ncbi:MAG: hypothetical protein IPJ29_12715 [Chitinophagaceae bacterium]|nr:hypothetical protein [Chitinophagaceae bacterium]